MKLAFAVIGAVVGAFVGGAPGFFIGGIAALAVGMIVDGELARVRADGINELKKVEAAFSAQNARIDALEKSAMAPEDRSEAAAPASPAFENPAPPVSAPDWQIAPFESLAAAAESAHKSAAPEQVPHEAAAHTEIPLATTQPAPSKAAAGATPPGQAAQASRASSSTPPRDDPGFIWNWFFGGNAMVRIGVVILFFGVAFLIKYAAEHVTVPIELRLAGIALGAMLMLGIGWRLRRRRGAYGLLLQGGGIGILYLVIFGAFRLWDLLPASFTMALLFAIAVLSAVLAILQNAPALAIAGASGGFLAPILASTGGGSHVGLFSYYFVLNLGLLAIAWFRAWRVLNVVGFVFTFAIGALWGAKYYQPHFFSTTEPFLVLFFLMYVAIAVLFALRRAPELKDYVDTILVFGTPAVAFGLQLKLAADWEYGAAWSAMALALFYMVLAHVLWRMKRSSLQLLVECFGALSVVFATLAIPLALDERWTSAIWALEGLGAIWMGFRQKRLLPRAFGILLQFAAGAAFLQEQNTAAPLIPLMNIDFLGTLMIGASGIVAALLIQRSGRDKAASGNEQGISLLLLVWGLLWWFGGGWSEIDRWLAGAAQNHAMLAYCAAGALLLGLLGRRWDWDLPRLLSFALLPILIFFAGLAVIHHYQPGEAYGWLAWPFAVAALYVLLWRHEDIAPSVQAFHCLALWLWVFLLTWECGMRIEDAVGGGRVWALVAWPLIPTLVTLAVSTRTPDHGWPFSEHLDAYLHRGVALLLLAVYAWIWYANFSSNGDPSPLPYVPVVNPLDLVVMLAALAGIVWLRATRQWLSDEVAQALRGLFLPAFGAAAFMWMNAILLRSLHHYAQIPFALDAMLRSTLVQAAFSIFWTLIALAAMLWAHWRKQRVPWLAGAALLGVVVLKLFFIDLSRIAGLERIVSFLGVGVLMLVIGFFVPVPPREKEAVQ